MCLEAVSLAGAGHAVLAFVKCSVQKGIVKQKASAFSPALGLAAHHQLAVAGSLQTFRYKTRERKEDTCGSGELCLGG